MFTGIVKTIGTVSRATKSGGGMECEITVPLRRRWKRGESVLVDGVCSTVTKSRGRTLTFTFMKETCEKTAICWYKRGTRVNIEPSLRVGDDLSGHILSGHIDGRGQIGTRTQRGMMTRLGIEIPSVLVRYFVPKGSVAVDGISMTIVAARRKGFSVACIPYTLSHSTLGLKKSGDWVNIEVDMMAKYVEQICFKKNA